MANQELVPVTSYTLSPAEYALLEGDLSQLTNGDRLNLYNAVCASVGLNPLTCPFEYIKLNGKLKMYAKKDCTDQLRKIHNVSITDLAENWADGLYIVTAKAQDGTGRYDAAKGAVFLKGLAGEALANAIMKAETKAKRRVTLSICGLGMLDESETGNIPGAEIVPHTQISSTQAPAAEDPLKSRRTRALNTFKDHFDKSVLDKVLPVESLVFSESGVIHMGRTFLQMSAADLDTIEEFMATGAIQQPAPTEDLVEEAVAA